MKRTIFSAIALLVFAQTPAHALGAFPCMPTFWPEDSTPKADDTVSRDRVADAAANIWADADR